MGQSPKLVSPAVFTSRFRLPADGDGVDAGEAQGERFAAASQDRARFVPRGASAHAHHDAEGLRRDGVELPGWGHSPDGDGPTRAGRFSR